MSAKKYKLIEAQYPKVENGILIDDLGLGGIKLTYEVSDNLTKVTAKNRKTIVFLKPLKKHWVTKNTPKHEKGIKKSPLSNVWVQLEQESKYTNFEKEIEIIRYVNDEPIKDSQLIGELNKVDKPKEFVIGTDEPLVQLTLLDRMWLAFHLYNPFEKK